MENTEYTNFTTRQPTDVVERLDGAAFQRFRKKNCRNLLITEILEEWLQNHAPPSQPIAKSRNGHSKQNGRKKAAV